MATTTNSKINSLLPIALNLAAELILVGLLVGLVDSWPFGFIATFLGIQVFRTVTWLVGSIFNWTSFKLYGRKKAVANLLEHLKSAGYPEPDNSWTTDREQSTDDYFHGVLNDEKLPFPLRLSAAELSLAQTFLGSSVQMQALFRTMIITTDAVKAYKKTFAEQKLVKVT